MSETTNLVIVKGSWLPCPCGDPAVVGIEMRLNDKHPVSPRRPYLYYCLPCLPKKHRKRAENLLLVHRLLEGLDK